MRKTRWLVQVHSLWQEPNVTEEWWETATGAFARARDMYSSFGAYVHDLVVSVVEVSA